MDINPATRGHALVIPREHADRPATRSPAEDLAAHARSPRSGSPRARASALGADGVNLLNSCGPAAWQTVFHFHVHVIPRYADDPLKLPWIPRGGDTDEIAPAAGEAARRRMTDAANGRRARRTARSS